MYVGLDRLVEHFQIQGVFCMCMCRSRAVDLTSSVNIESNEGFR